MPRGELFEERLTESIIGAFFEVYNTLGFGFLENHYALALERELIARGHRVAREVSVQVLYKGVSVGQLRLDMIVDGKVVVETKAGTELREFAIRQCHSYLRASHLEVGLVLFFGPKPAIKRLVSRQHARFQPVVVRDVVPWGIVAGEIGL